MDLETVTKSLKRVVQRNSVVLSLVAISPIMTFAATESSLAPACTAGTVADYEAINSDHECSIGILNLESFTFSSSGTSTATILPDTDIEVTPFSPDGLTGGFTLTPIVGSFSALGGENADYMIDYDFAIDPAPLFSGADIGMDPPASDPFGDVTITQAICADSEFLPGAVDACGFPTRGGSTPAQTFSISDNNPPTSWTNHLDLNPPAMDFAEVQTSININDSDGAAGAGFPLFTATEDVTLSTPEPATFGLAAAALLMVGFRRRRSRRVLP